MKLICLKSEKDLVNYQNFLFYIRHLDGWIHLFENLWIVKTEKTIEELTNDLMNFLRSSNKLLVTEFNADNYDGFLIKEDFDWIERNRHEI